MDQRHIFKCWNCGRNYSLLRELRNQLQFAVKCPFCYKDGMVDLNHYLEASVEVFESALSHQNHACHDFNLPEIICTTQSAE